MPHSHCKLPKLISIPLKTFKKENAANLLRSKCLQGGLRWRCSPSRFPSGFEGVRIKPCRSVLKGRCYCKKLPNNALLSLMPFHFKPGFLNRVFLVPSATRRSVLPFFQPISPSLVSKYKPLTKPDATGFM